MNKEIIQSWATGVVMLFCSGLYGQSPVVHENFHGRPLAELLLHVDSASDWRIYSYLPWLDSVNVVQDSVPQHLLSILERSPQFGDFHLHLSNQNKLYIWRGTPISLKLSPAAPLIPPRAMQRSLAAAEEMVRLTNQRPAPNGGSQQRELINIGSGQATGEAIVSGRVRDMITGTAISGATISIPALGIGAYSDEDGYFSFSLPVGSHEMRVRAVGMAEVIQPLGVNGEGIVEIEMEEAIRELDEVVIEAEARSNIDGAQMGVNTVGIQTMKEMPALLGEVDLVKTAILLPGVQTVGEGAGGFNVRGGGVDQNLVLLNHAPVFNPSHLFGFFSAFHPDVVSNFELYKSGIPARYGGRISSVFEVGIKDGNRRNYEFQAGISPITARATFQGPITRNKGSFIIGGRSTYSDWILRQLPDLTFQNSRAGFADVNAHASYELNADNQLSASAYWSSDRFTLNRDTTFAYQNLASTLSWKHFFTRKLYSEFTGVFSQYHFQVGSTSIPQQAYQLDYQVRHHEGKADVTWLLHQDHYVRFGANAIWYRLEPGNFLPSGTESLIVPNRLQQEQALESALYLSDEWRINERVLLYAGLRFSSFTAFGPRDVFVYGDNQPRSTGSIRDTTTIAPGQVLSQYQGPEFRATFRYSLSENSSIKASYNRSRQYLHRISNTISISPTDTWKLSDPYIRPQVGDQYAFGFFRNFRQNSIETSIEAYVKPIQNLIDYKAGADLIMNEHLETELVNARGRAYGIEFLIRKNTGKLNGWLGYTYSRSLVKIAGEFEEETVNQGAWFPANFDKPHDVTLVLNYRITRRLSFSGTMTYSTGRPVTLPVAQYRYGNSNRVYYSDRNAYRIPDYFRTDFSMNVEGSHRIKKLAHSSWSFSVYNLTGRRNPYSVYFVAQDGQVQGYQLSIFGRPFATVSYQFRI